MSAPITQATPVASTPAQTSGTPAPLPSAPINGAAIAAAAPAAKLPGASTQPDWTNPAIDAQGRVVIHVPITPEQSRGKLRIGYQGRDNGEVISSGENAGQPTDLKSTTAIDCKDRYSIKKIAGNDGTTHFEITVDSRVDLLSLTVDGRPIKISQAAVREQIDKAKAASALPAPAPASVVAAGASVETLPTPAPIQAATPAAAESEQKIETLEQKVKELNDQVQNLQQQLAALQQQVTGLEKNPVGANDDSGVSSSHATEVPTPLEPGYVPPAAEVLTSPVDAAASSPIVPPAENTVDQAPAAEPTPGAITDSQVGETTGQKNESAVPESTTPLADPLASAPTTEAPRAQEVTRSLARIEEIASQPVKFTASNGLELTYPQLGKGATFTTSEGEAGIYYDSFDSIEEFRLAEMKDIVKTLCGLKGNILLSVPTEAVRSVPGSTFVVTNYESLEIFDKQSGSSIGVLKFTHPASVKLKNGTEITASTSLETKPDKPALESNLFDPPVETPKAIQETPAPIPPPPVDAGAQIDVAPTYSTLNTSEQGSPTLPPQMGDALDRAASAVKHLSGAAFEKFRQLEEVRVIKSAGEYMADGASNLAERGGELLENMGRIVNAAFRPTAVEESLDKSATTFARDILRSVIRAAQPGASEAPSVGDSQAPSTIGFDEAIKVLTRGSEGGTRDGVGLNRLIRAGDKLVEAIIRDQCDSKSQAAERRITALKNDEFSSSIFLNVLREYGAKMTNNPQSGPDQNAVEQRGIALIQALTSIRLQALRASEQTDTDEMIY